MKGTIKINVDLLPDKKIIKTFIGSEREINYIDLIPPIRPISSKVIKDSPAYNAGIMNNDIIIEINGKKTRI